MLAACRPSGAGGEAGTVDPDDRSAPCRVGTVVVDILLDPQIAVAVEGEAGEDQVGLRLRHRIFG